MRIFLWHVPTKLSFRGIQFPMEMCYLPTFEEEHWLLKQMIKNLGATNSYNDECIARPPHEPPAILSCTPELAGYPLDPTQLRHG